MKWNPWTTKGGTLQLQEFPDHPLGTVEIEVDVFEPFDGPVVDSDGDMVCHILPPGVGSHDTDPRDYDDCLQALFAHIDAHPETHYTLRTLHPERVREAWPDVVCRIVHPASGNPHAPSWCLTHDSPMAVIAYDCKEAVWRPSNRRRNVTLSLGPLATQADADRLVSEVLECGGLVNGDLEAYCQPTERIDFTEIARDDGWMIDSLQGVYTREYPPGIDHPGGIEGHGGGPRFTRVRVAGGENEHARDLQHQAATAGVEFQCDRRLDLPDPRSDGVCVDCEKKPVDSRDGRFCLQCLRNRIREESPDMRSAVREQYGRSARSSKALGGTANMREDEIEGEL